MAHLSLHHLLNGDPKTINFATVQENHRHSTSSRSRRKYILFHCVLALLTISSLPAHSKNLTKLCKATPEQLSQLNDPAFIAKILKYKNKYNLQTKEKNIPPESPSQRQARLCTPRANRSS
ncbi:hypothetical protein J1G35_20525 [Pseudomonas sp. SH10-3B]|uniref:hypothetical protein n=1 Tax=Pseudomonas sp. SH10-3B TaxID=2816049 RepID=UPI001CA6E27F|nr:hypothetical protein [Pseudomonas sp. SH10-3B]MBY8948249.1 hypothetical protein [Pseudomonas sp. SH10-3B]